MVRSYHRDYTASHQHSAVKLCWALSVLGLVTSWEPRVTHCTFLETEKRVLKRNAEKIFFDPLPSPARRHPVLAMLPLACGTDGSVEEAQDAKETASNGQETLSHRAAPRNAAHDGRMRGWEGATAGGRGGGRQQASKGAGRGLQGRQRLWGAGL